MSRFRPEPEWPPNPDNTSVKVTELTDFYYGDPRMNYQDEHGINNFLNGLTVQEAVALVITTLNDPNNTSSETMSIIAEQMNDNYNDPFCSNAHLDTVIYCPFDETKGYHNRLYTGYHNGIPDIIEPVKEWFYQPYGNERLEAYKAIGIDEGQLLEQFNADIPDEDLIHILFIRKVRHLIDMKYRLLHNVFGRFGILLKDHNKFNLNHFPSLKIEHNVLHQMQFGLLGGKKYKNKIVNIPVIPEKKTRKNKKPKECYKNCESVPSGLCATGCKPSWTSKRKIRSRNWCHCNIDKTKCSIHICRSKTKKKKNKKKYSKNKSRKSK
jgi:hypothetical protein